MRTDISWAKIKIHPLSNLLIIFLFQESNVPLLGRTLGVAEWSLKFAGRTAVNPVLAKFESRINSTDEIALKSFTDLEVKYPPLKQDTREAVKSISNHFKVWSFLQHPWYIIHQTWTSCPYYPRDVLACMTVSKSLRIKFN